MLKKQNRLLTNYEHSKVRRLGKKVNSESFYCYILDSSRFEGDKRAGVVISTVTEKSAVKRNRTKRVFSEVLRLNFDRIKAGIWILLYPKKEALNKNYEEINVEFNKILQNIFVN